jgi:hypothetical protein
MSHFVAVMRHDGYRAHVAADPETGIITDEKLTGAAGQDNSDPAVAAEFLAAGAAALPGMPSAARTPVITVTVTSRLPGTAIRPTGPGTCARRSPQPDTRR